MRGCHGCASTISVAAAPRCYLLKLSRGGRSWARWGTHKIGLTMNTYGHLTPSMEADMAARMDAILLRDDIFSPRLATDLAASLVSAKEE
jgi:hypothetical protein